MKKHNILLNFERQGPHLVLKIPVLLPNGLLSLYAQQVLLPPSNKLLPSKFNLINMKLIPLKELTQNIEISDLIGF
jgi:hypothetical protein